MKAFDQNGLGFETVNEIKSFKRIYNMLDPGVFFSMATFLSLKLLFFIFTDHGPKSIDIILYQCR
jgi:hypothetical protein